MNPQVKVQMSNKRTGDTPDAGEAKHAHREYAGPMTASVRDVAAAIRERLPDAGTTKLHKLLYKCQGHHLAWFGEPLFREDIQAWDLGPVVADLWHAEKRAGIQPGNPKAIGEAGLGTVGWVCARYGQLTAQNLINMTHDESPWQVADADRIPGARALIELTWIKHFFSQPDEDEPRADSEAVRRILVAAVARRDAPRQRDDKAAFQAELATRLAR